MKAVRELLKDEYYSEIQLKAMKGDQRAQRKAKESQRRKTRKRKTNTWRPLSEKRKGVYNAIKRNLVKMAKDLGCATRASGKACIVESKSTGFLRTS